MSESFAQLFNESIKPLDTKDGAIVVAQVLGIDGNYVMVDAGLKSEALIPREEFLDENGELHLEVGDMVEVALDTIEDGFGETRLSRERARRAKTWKMLEDAYEGGKTVLGVISGAVRGGFTVEIDTLRGFLPGSQIDVRAVDVADTTQHEFKVIKLARKNNNIVLSRRAVLHEENGADRQALLEQLEEGSEVPGIVKNLTDYGAFVDLGGIDGLLHLADMAWRRPSHPSNVVKVGDKIDVKILKIIRSEKDDRVRISLGLKQMGNDPWIDIARRYPLKSRLFGKVTSVMDYGCFVEIEDGIEGLVHVSEMDWTNHHVLPSKVVKLGDEVEVMVLDIDEDRRRISLGLKQCVQNPWAIFASAHSKGEQVTGRIKSITDFGIFIGLDGGIDGLVHLSDISWDESGEEAIRQFKKGEEVTAVILSIDSERERISLGVKQLNADEFSIYIQEHPKGSVVTGKVTAVEAKQATIELADGITGILTKQEYGPEMVEDLSTALKVGDEIEAKISNVDRKNSQIQLSIKALQARMLAEASKQLRDSAPTHTLGDALKQQMEDQANNEE